MFFGEELAAVPPNVVLALRDAVSRSCVDDFWSIWSRKAEAGLFRAYSLAGGPTEAGSSAFFGRGLLRIRSRRLEWCWPARIFLLVVMLVLGLSV